MATQWTAGTTAGQVLTAATMNTIGAAWETWTPALTASTTNPTLGTGAIQTGRWGRVNKTVFGQGTIKFGTAGTAAGNGTYLVSVPTAAQAATGGPVGNFFVYDNGINVRVGVLILGTTTVCSMRYDAGALVNNAAPWAWGANMTISYSFSYEAA